MGYLLFGLAGFLVAHTVTPTPTIELIRPDYHVPVPSSSPQPRPLNLNLVVPEKGSFQVYDVRPPSGCLNDCDKLPLDLGNGVNLGIQGGNSVGAGYAVLFH